MNPDSELARDRDVLMPMIFPSVFTIGLPAMIDAAEIFVSMIDFPSIEVTTPGAIRETVFPEMATTEVPSTVLSVTILAGTHTGAFSVEVAG
jgi:hypothetical protein